MENRTLLLEIGTEEIPARFIPGALQDLKSLAHERLASARLVHQGIQTWGTPRRLALWVDVVAPFQEDQEEKLIGPPRTAAFDSQGRPTAVAHGFARAKGVRIEDLVPLETPKGIYMGLVRRTRGLPAVEVLSEILPQLIRDLHFPKFMRWGTSPFRFVRPLHWLLALFGDQVIPFSLEGITAGNLTYGHRFLAPQAIFIAHPSEYLGSLREGQVIVDPEERRTLMVQGIVEEAGKRGGGRLAGRKALGRGHFFGRISGTGQWVFLRRIFRIATGSPGDLYERASKIFPRRKRRRTALALFYSSKQHPG